MVWGMAHQGLPERLPEILSDDDARVSRAQLYLPVYHEGRSAIGGTRPAPVEPYEAVLLALLMIGALAVTMATQPLTAVLTLGLVGLLGVLPVCRLTGS